MLRSPLERILENSGRRHRKACSSFGLTPASECLEERQLLTADVVLQWNDVLLDAVRVDKTAPPKASRDMAIVHTAIYDAVNSIDREYAPYLTMVDVHPRASKEAAVVSAAYETLVVLFPAQKTAFDARRMSSLAEIQDGRAETDGINAGKAVAALILAQRATDGSSTTVTWTPGTDPGDWQPTPPAFASPLLPQWGDVQPWTMRSGTQFQPGAPPLVTSEKYATDFNQVKQIGSATSTTRTTDQTAIAQFWANGPGTSAPPGHWNVIAQTVAENRHTSLEENARLFALLNIALADAAIVSWDAKYEFDMWRPVTAIQQADTDNNSKTVAIAGWTPLLVTPPFPTYTSGHSTFSGAGAAVLKAFFKTDKIRFVVPSETSGIADRSFTSFTQAADESGISRIYAGIHFNFDNTAGLQSGKRLGNYVAASFLKKDVGTATAKLINGELFVNGTSRADTIRILQGAGTLSVTVNHRRLGDFSRSQVVYIVVDAGAGNDFVSLGGVDVTSEIYGGAGSDVLIGGAAADRIFGEAGRDRLFGRRGNDYLDGGEGRNRLFGNAGNDVLRGIHVLDRLFGGQGIDELLWGVTT